MEVPPLVVTQGDPSGIGPEIALQAWTRRSAGLPCFYVIADPALLHRRAREVGVDVPIVEVAPDEAAAVFGRGLPVHPLERRVRGVAGRPDPEDAAATVEAIDVAVRHLRTGAAGAVVTNPIAKQVLYAAGFAHPGHTEYLGELARELWGTAVAEPVMMLWCEHLAVVPVTIHVPLNRVPALLTGEVIRRTARTVAVDLRDRFGVAAPRLACAGLNPHAGEGGSLGREEIDVIIPALEALRAEGMDITGPWPADTLFTPAARAGADAVLAMYHDQGLIPIKALAFDEAVNVTLGLPFIRTSPDHGTAFDIAGRGVARPTSLMAALRLADRLARADRRTPA